MRVLSANEGVVLVILVSCFASCGKVLICFPKEINFEKKFLFNELFFWWREGRVIFENVGVTLVLYDLKQHRPLW